MKGRRKQASRRFKTYRGPVNPGYGNQFGFNPGYGMGQPIVQPQFAQPMAQPFVQAAQPNYGMPYQVAPMRMARQPKVYNNAPLGQRLQRALAYKNAKIQQRSAMKGMPAPFQYVNAQPVDVPQLLFVLVKQRSYDGRQSLTKRVFHLSENDKLTATQKYRKNYGMRQMNYGYNQSQGFQQKQVIAGNMLRGRRVAQPQQYAPQQYAQPNYGQPVMNDEEEIFLDNFA
jgi:hypothetical protein